MSKLLNDMQDVYKRVEELEKINTELLKTCKDILVHDGGAYNLESRQSKKLMAVIRKIESKSNA
jgi:hypothetical protein